MHTHSRRSALIKIATAATSAAMTPLLADTPEAEHHSHEMSDKTAAPVVTQPAYFSQADWETVSKLSDLIIPRTDTPGAVDAGVPHWIDYHVAADPELQEKFKQGLAYLAEQAHTIGGSSFSALTAQQQTAILQALSTDADTAKSGFFRTVKDLTIDGYYNSEEGMVKELTFKGNTFRATFPGCTHPEHWPTTASGDQTK